MNKKTLKILALLSAIASANLTAIQDEFRTPVPLERGYAYSHYPFADYGYEEGRCWGVQVWGAGWHKSANRSFINKDTTAKESLSGIFFGADSFTISQAFAPGTVVPDNPLLFISKITPNFDYNEEGAIFGANLETVLGCDCQWRVGLRTRIPFRSLKSALDSCCELEDISNVQQLAFEQNEIDPDPDNVNGEINNAFAYRMDLVARLHKNANQTSPTDLLLQCNDTSLTAPLLPQITISQQLLGNEGDVAGNNNHPVHVISRTDGTPPLFPSVPFFGLRSTSNMASVGSVNGGVDGPLPFLAADGSGLANNQRARFAGQVGTTPPTINYTPLCSSPNLATLWLVPTLDGRVGTPPQPDTFDPSQVAMAIQEDINNALIAIRSNNVSSFLSGLGVNFDTARRNGIGNFDTELYARYDDSNCGWGPWFAEGIFGVRWPTDSITTATNQLLLVSTGNNRHYEIKLGGYLGWNPCEWFAVKADAWYYWTLRHTQTVAAPFTGATIFGVGPGVDAHVRWQYFIGDIDFTFLVPCVDPYVGVNVGYQAWVKRKTHVSLDVSSALDFFGVTQPLDSTILESRTKRISHTIKAEIFKQTCDWQLFAGWNHTFAGKNSLNDTDWYLGLEVYF